MVVAKLFRNRFRTGAENQTFNGGTSLYYGGVNNFFLRATFDDCSSPAVVQWDQITLTTANATRVFYDPILYTDHWTGRTFVARSSGSPRAAARFNLPTTMATRWIERGRRSLRRRRSPDDRRRTFHEPAPATVIRAGQHVLPACRLLCVAIHRDRDEPVKHRWRHHLIRFRGRCSRSAIARGCTDT